MLTHGFSLVGGRQGNKKVKSLGVCLGNVDTRTVWPLCHYKLQGNDPGPGFGHFLGPLNAVRQQMRHHKPG